MAALVGTRFLTSVAALALAADSEPDSDRFAGFEDEDEEVEFTYEHASLCEATHETALALGIRIDRDLRVMRDITYRSPAKVPVGELLEESKRMLRANGLDLIQQGEDRYVIVPLGVRSPRAPEDPCSFPSERRIRKELRVRRRAWKMLHSGQPLPSRVRPSGRPNSAEPTE